MTRVNFYYIIQAVFKVTMSSIFLQTLKRETWAHILQSELNMNWSKQILPCVEQHSVSWSVGYPAMDCIGVTYINVWSFPFPTSWGKRSMKSSVAWWYQSSPCFQIRMKNDSYWFHILIFFSNCFNVCIKIHKLNWTIS